MSNLSCANGKNKPAMEEDEFRTTYHQVNPQRCSFEKTLLARWANCHFAQRFSLGEREGVACSSTESQTRCHFLLQRLHENSHFALGMTHMAGPLPHAKEMKVQIGGLLGLRQLIETQVQATDTITDVDNLLNKVCTTYPDLDTLPYPTLARSIVKFEVRRKTHR